MWYFQIEDFLASQPGYALVKLGDNSCQLQILTDFELVLATLTVLAGLGILILFFSMMMGSASKLRKPLFLFFGVFFLSLLVFYQATDVSYLFDWERDQFIERFHIAGFNHQSTLESISTCLGVGVHGIEAANDELRTEEYTVVLIAGNGQLYKLSRWYGLYKEALKAATDIAGTLDLSLYPGQRNAGVTVSQDAEGNPVVETIPLPQEGGIDWPLTLILIALVLVIIRESSLRKE